jgi:hypothetical protein
LQGVKLIIVRVDEKQDTDGSDVHRLYCNDGTTFGLEDSALNGFDSAAAAEEYQVRVRENE